MAWKELNIHPRISAALEKAELQSYANLLCTTDGELRRLTKLSSKDIETLRKAVSEAIVRHPPKSVLQLLKDSGSADETDGKLSVGCRAVDDFLQGGILTKRVTEIAGESGSGKTQFCLQLSLNVQLPPERGGLDAGVAYICTEDAFPSKRLRQMIDSFSKKASKLNLTDNVYVQHIADMDGLKHCLDRQLPVLLNRKKIKLVVLDSVAVIFRTDYDPREIFARSSDIHWVGATLNRLCSEHDVTVVCTNQVTDLIDSHSKQKDRKKVPSLGLSWSNFVCTRLMVSRTSLHLHVTPQTRTKEGPDLTLSSSVQQPRSVIRRLETVFAPHLPKANCQFVVDDEGIKGLINGRHSEL